jgi:hypothetical protein
MRARHCGLAADGAGLPCLSADGNRGLRDRRARDQQHSQDGT